MLHPTLIFCTLLAVLIAAIVLLKPLFLNPPKPYFIPDADGSEFDESLALLEMIAELEADFQAKKISQADFDAMSLEYKREYLQKKSGNNR